MATPVAPSIIERNIASSPDEKIMQDLDTLVDRIKLSSDMFKQNNYSVNSESDEVMLQVFGFLKACQPRMIELVEAATQGALQEGTLMRCLEVNDLLTRSLDFKDVDKDAIDSSQFQAQAKVASPVAVSSDVKSSARFQQPSGDYPFVDQPDLMEPKIIFNRSNLKDDVDFFEDNEKRKDALKNSDEILELLGDDLKNDNTSNSFVKDKANIETDEDDFDIFLRERAGSNEKFN